jgi:hypothetical protein
LHNVVPKYQGLWQAVTTDQTSSLKDFAWHQIKKRNNAWSFPGSISFQK